MYDCVIPKRSGSGYPTYASNRSAAGASPETHCRSSQRSPRPPLLANGRGKEGKGRGTEGRRNSGRRGRERRRGCLLLNLNLATPLHSVIEPHVSCNPQCRPLDTPFAICMCMCMYALDHRVIHWRSQQNVADISIPLESQHVGHQHLVLTLLAQASISIRSLSQDPTTFKAWSGPNIGGPAHPTNPVGSRSYYLHPKCKENFGNNFDFTDARR